MVGKRSCIVRITRASTVPSPTPASNTRTAGGRGCRLASSRPTRLAISHFSEQVFTNSRYFCRLSKKRKLRLGSSPACPDATGGAGGATTGRPVAGASNRTRRRPGIPSTLRAMKARIRSSVSVVMRPPLRSRLASLPSLTARRPKVDSARPRRRQNSPISCRICSFMAALPRAALKAVLRIANQVRAGASTRKAPVGKMGEVGGLFPHRIIGIISRQRRRSAPKKLRFGAFAHDIAFNCGLSGRQRCDLAHSNVEENRLAVALHADVEAVNALTAARLLVGK